MRIILGPKGGLLTNLGKTLLQVAEFDVYVIVGGGVGAARFELREELRGEGVDV